MKHRRINDLIEKTNYLKVLYLNNKKKIDHSTIKILNLFFKNLSIKTINNIMDINNFIKILEIEFDIIIVDINNFDIMMELIQRIISIKKVNIILITSNKTENNIYKIINLDISGFIFKPIDFVKFTFTIKRVIKDLDIRKNSEKNLIEQNRELKKLNFNYKKILNSFNKNVIYSRTDLSGNILSVSEAFCKISGYSEKELIGQSHNIVKSPDMESVIFAYMWNTIEQGIPWEGDIKNRRKDGSSYWVNTYIEPYYNEEGKHIGYTAIRKDIAAQKEVEKLNFSLEMKVQERTKSLYEAKQATEILHKHTKESIEYASLIQSSLLPDNNVFRKYFKEYFVIWHPRDAVGGDIYFFEELKENKECLIIMVDCTGHGVPGAFVTMLVKSLEVSILNDISNNPDREVSPAKILSQFNKGIKELLYQKDYSSALNAGFDGAILFYDKVKNIIKFSGANTPLFYVEDDELKTKSGDRSYIGDKRTDIEHQFKEYKIEIQGDSCFYLTTDGYTDQNGGKRGFPFGKKRFRGVINSYSSETMADQQEMFLYELAEYEEDNQRNDDITVIAIRI